MWPQLTMNGSNLRIYSILDLECLQFGTRARASVLKMCIAYGIALFGSLSLFLQCSRGLAQEAGWSVRVVVVPFFLHFFPMGRILGAYCYAGVQNRSQYPTNIVASSRVNIPQRKGVVTFSFSYRGRVGWLGWKWQT